MLILGLGQILSGTGAGATRSCAEGLQEWTILFWFKEFSMPMAYWQCLYSKQDYRGHPGKAILDQ